ncbi:MAG: hypothetical protein Q9217_002308 [Psora testacea]
MEMKGQPLSASQFHKITLPEIGFREYTLFDNLLFLGKPPEKNHHISARTGLGALDKFPLELLQMLLLQFDLRTLTDFRRVNQRALQVTESIPQYKAITTCAREALHGILIIETGRWITCETLYEKLCTAECEECGAFAGYLYILTCRRVCLVCLGEHKRYLPLRYSHAIRKFGVNHRILDTLPHMRSMAGAYSPNVRVCREQLALVDPESAYQAGIAVHKSLDAMKQYVSDIAAQKLREYHERESLAKSKGHVSTLRRLRRPQTEDSFDGGLRNPMRFMAIVRMPWLHRDSQKLEWGFHCLGCRNFLGGGPLYYKRKFSVASFIEHLRQHGNIRDDKNHHLD